MGESNETDFEHQAVSMCGVEAGCAAKEGKDAERRAGRLRQLGAS